MKDIDDTAIENRIYSENKTQNNQHRKIISDFLRVILIILCLIIHYLF